MDNRKQNKSWNRAVWTCHALAGALIGLTIPALIVVSNFGCETVEEEPEPNLMVTLDTASEASLLRIRDHQLPLVGASIEISVPTLVPVKSGDECLLDGGRLTVVEEVSLLAVRLEYTPPETEAGSTPPPNLCTSEQEIMMTWRDLFLISTINAN